MSDRSVWRPFLPWHRYAGALGLSLALILSLSFVQGAAQASPWADGLSRGAGLAPSRQEAADDTLRNLVIRDGWVLVRVQLREPQQAASRDAAQAASWWEDTNRTAEDLLFGLPDGSWDSAQREAGAASLTLRVDAAGLDELLASPLVTAVAAAVNPAMLRIAAGGSGHSLAVKPDASL